LYIQVVLETLVASLKAAAKSMIPGIAREDVLKSLLPLPPYAEQKRIVSKLSEIAQFVAMYSLRENALNRLYSSFPDQLRKSILQMAVQGKLIPQDPTDEPASVLLERIRAEKQRLVKEGKIKKDKHESVIFRRDNSHYEKRGSEEVCIDDEIPFEIPENWCWARMGSYLDVRDGTHDTPKYVLEGIPLVTSKNLCNGKIDFSTAKFISREDHLAISLRSKVDAGDIMYAMIGSIGNPVLDCQHFFRQIFLGYFSDIVQAFDTLRKNVCGDDYTSLHNPIVLSSVLPAYGMFHSIQILFL